MAGALIGVVGTATATLGSQALTIARDHQREKARAQLEAAREKAERLREARDLMDGAAYSLKSAGNVLDRMIIFFTPLATHGLLEGPPTAIVAEFQNKVADAFILETKLTVRLPESANVCSDLHGVTVILEEVSTALATLVGPAASRDPGIRQMGDSDSQRLLDTLTRLRTDLKEAEAQFLTSARAAFADDIS